MVMELWALTTKKIRDRARSVWKANSPSWAQNLEPSPARRSFRLVLGGNWCPKHPVAPLPSGFPEVVTYDLLRRSESLRRRPSDGSLHCTWGMLGRTSLANFGGETCGGSHWVPEHGEIYHIFMTILKIVSLQEMMNGNHFFGDMIFGPTQRWKFYQLNLGFKF
jgi:hypothetical protein